MLQVPLGCRILQHQLPARSSGSQSRRSGFRVTRWTRTPCVRRGVRGLGTPLQTGGSFQRTEKINVPDWR